MTSKIIPVTGTKESQVMLTSLQGVYQKGRIEINETPMNVLNETPVIVTFLEQDVDLCAYGINEAQAEELRGRLVSFVEEWNAPEMDEYDHYNAAKSAL